MNLQTFLSDLLIFLDNTILPFLLAIAFIVFIWNIARYFIIGGANSENHEKAKSVALWGIIAFVIIMIFWGIVNLFIEASGLDVSVTPITPDYVIQREVERGFGSGDLPF